MAYDYRGARDQVMGIVRDGDGRPVGYVPSETPIRERMLLVALVEFAPDIRPSKATLAILLGVGEREVQRLIRSAEARGLIRIESRTGQANRYHLTLRTHDKSDSRDVSVTRDRTDSPPETEPTPPPETEPTPEADKISRQPSGQDCASHGDTPPLALEPPSSKPERNARSGGKRKNKPAKEAPDPRVHLLKEHYVAEYLRTQETDPVIAEDQWGRAMKAFKKLLGAAKDLNRAKQIITEAFVTELWDCRGKFQPWEILANANKLAAKPSPRKANGYAPQHSGVDVEAKWAQEQQ